MISYSDAEYALNEQEVTPASESIPIETAVYRILADAIAAPIDVPPFAKAAMDGFACRHNDRAPWLTINATIAAGQFPERPIASGECARIMTGAMIPSGADQVIRKEFSEENNGLVRFICQENKTNIIPRGEDLHKGDPALPAGIRLKPQHIAFLASLGIPRVEVYHQARVSVITTGSELLMPGEPLQEGKIFNSNRFSLAAQIEAAGSQTNASVLVADDPRSIHEAVSRALSDADMIILSGGVSAGDFDFVPSVLKEAGVEVIFAKVAVQPGMPTLFGRKGTKFIFGLPGNPVSTFIIFEMFIKPFLFRLAGHHWVPRTVPGTLREPLGRKDLSRTYFALVSISADGIHPVSYHGSAHLHALTRADAIVIVPAGVAEIPAGTTVHARLL